MGTLTNGEDAFELDKNGHLSFADGDPKNPQNYSFRHKCHITVVAITMVMNATFSSTAPSGAVQGISDDLHVSAEAAGLVTTMFLLGYVAGPLLWAPLSEFYGRRLIFWVSFVLYITFNFLCAFTPDFAGLIIGRFITGAAASAALTNAPGILADIWGPNARGIAMILFTTMTFAGPALGPVVSGFLQLKETWRWTFYVLLWMAAPTAIMLLTLPETLPMLALRAKARRIRNETGRKDVLAPVEASNRSLSNIFRVSLTRPWKLLFDPISFFVAIYYSVVYTLLYMLFSIYPIVFQQHRGWNAGVGELPLLGTIVGALLGGAILIYLSLKRQKEREASHRKALPEDSLVGGMIGAPLFAISIFWFAWTAEYNSIPWAVPTTAGAFLAMSILLIFFALVNYVIESYLAFAASALAANTILRSACAASSPLFTQYMFDALGIGGAGSLIGGIAVLLMPMPFVFYKYGPAIRARSKYAKTDETLKGAKDEEEGAADGDEMRSRD